MLKSGDLGPTGLVVGQSGWEAQNRENPTRSGDITCMLTPALCHPTLKQDHITHDIISSCTKKYTHKILLLEIIQNTSSSMRYFF